MSTPIAERIRAEADISARPGQSRALRDIADEVERLERVAATVPPMDPDCRAGKHAACLGRAWDDVTDGQVQCQCACHKPGLAL